MTLKEWFMWNLTVAPTGLLSPAVDGFYIDDMWVVSFTLVTLRGHISSPSELFDVDAS